MTRAEMVPGADVVDHHPARILIVDDEPHNRHLLEVMLAPEGFLLDTAHSGEEALAWVAQHPPDLILLDVILPGIDGYEVAARIKDDSATTHIPVIMLSALGDREARVRGLNAGAEDFLGKPVDRAELCARVRTLLRLKAYVDQHDRYSRTLEADVASRTADLVERTRTLESQAVVLTEQAALLELAPSAIVVRDMASRILFWNRGAEVMFGWPREEALGQMASALLRTEFPEPSASLDDTLLREDRWAGEVIHSRRDGRRIIVASRWALQRDADGRPVRILTISNDITDLKRADAERRLLTERLSLATAVARVGVWDWDLASNALTWDATMFEMYGLPPVVPMAYDVWAAMVHPDDLSTVQATLREAIDTKGQAAGEFRIIAAGDSVRNITAAQRVVLDDDGNVRRVIGVNMDVTERKQAEEILEQSQKDQLRFKDEFLSHVSHELRSPLTAIKQFTTILLGGLAGELNDEQRQYHQIVLKNVRQLQSMIDDLLEVTRLETGKVTIEPESVSVADAVTDAVNTLQETARAKGVRLSSDVPADLPAAYADPTRLRQILIILLDNAIKFTQHGGFVRLQVREPDHGLLFEIADSGCGISKAIADKVFERLYQQSEFTDESRKGLGLGLFICKELVTRQGGQIWAEGRPQEGSTFSFTLPVCGSGNPVDPLPHNDTWPRQHADEDGDTARGRSQTTGTFGAHAS